MQINKQKILFYFFHLKVNEIETEILYCILYTVVVFHLSIKIIFFYIINLLCSCGWLDGWLDMDGLYKWMQIFNANQNVDVLSLN